jgi:DNA-binding transcriptional MerR regulator
MIFSNGKVLRGVDVARMFERTPTWLKWLERTGVIPPARRDPINGYRMYGPDDVERIRQILSQKRKAQEPAQVA